MRRTDHFLAVDPGVKYFAWVYVDGGLIREAGLDEDNRFLAHRWPGCSTCVCESQFSSSQYKVKDILNLARSAGEIAGQFQHRVYVQPSQLPKKLFQERGWDAMRESERNAIASLSKAAQYHVKDAASIAMKYLGRI